MRGLAYQTHLILKARSLSPLSPSSSRSHALLLALLERYTSAVESLSLLYSESRALITIGQDDEARTWTGVRQVTERKS